MIDTLLFTDTHVYVCIKMLRASSRWELHNVNAGHSSGSYIVAARRGNDQSDDLHRAIMSRDARERSRLTLSFSATVFPPAMKNR